MQYLCGYSFTHSFSDPLVPTHLELDRHRGRSRRVQDALKEIPAWLERQTSENRCRLQKVQ